MTRNCAHAVDFAGLCTHIYSWSLIYLLTMFYFVLQFLAKSFRKTCRLNAPMLILVHEITCLQIEMKDDHYQSHRCTRRVNIKCWIVLVVAETTAEKGNTHSNKILFSLYTGRFCRYPPQVFWSKFQVLQSMHLVNTENTNSNCIEWWLNLWNKYFIQRDFCLYQCILL